MTAKELGDHSMKKREEPKLPSMVLASLTVVGN